MILLRDEGERTMPDREFDESFDNSQLETDHDSSGLFEDSYDSQATQIAAKAIKGAQLPALELVDDNNEPEIKAAAQSALERQSQKESKTDKDGNAVEIDKRSGVETTRFKDGSYQQKTTIGDRDYTIKFDKDGKPLSHTDAEGEWTTKDGTTWTNGKSGRQWEGTVTITENGGVIFADKAEKGILSSGFHRYKDGTSARQESRGDTTIVTHFDKDGNPTTRLDQQGHWERKGNEWIHEKTGKEMSQYWNDKIGDKYFNGGENKNLWNGDYNGLSKDLKTAKESMSQEDFKKFVEKIEKGTGGAFSHTEANGEVTGIKFGDKTVLGEKSAWEKYTDKVGKPELLPPPSSDKFKGKIDNSQNDKPVVVVASVDGQYGKEMRLFVVQPGETTSDDIDIDGVVTDENVKPIQGPDGKWYPPTELAADTAITKVSGGVTAKIDGNGKIHDTERTAARIAADGASGGISGLFGANPIGLLYDGARQLTDTNAAGMSSNGGTYYAITPYKK